MINSFLFQLKTYKMNSIVLKLIAGNVVKRLRISTEDFDYKDLMAAAALSIPNGDLFFLSVDSEHTTKTIANEVEWKECKLEASDDTVPLRIHVTKIETDDTVDAVLITTERHDSQKIKADILKTKNKNKNFTENILNSVHRRKSINQSLIVLTKAEADAMRKEEAGVANGGLNMYQCLDCESKNCTSFQMQTRGAGKYKSTLCFIDFFLSFNLFLYVIYYQTYICLTMSFLTSCYIL